MPILVHKILKMPNNNICFVNPVVSINFHQLGKTSFIIIFFFIKIYHATSPKLYWSYYAHQSRELVSPVCGILYLCSDKFSLFCCGKFWTGETWILECWNQHREIVSSFFLTSDGCTPKTKSMTTGVNNRSILVWLNFLLCIYNSGIYFPSTLKSQTSKGKYCH